jgi:5-methylcytosine-specific restriction endonuclease McrA
MDKEKVGQAEKEITKKCFSEVIPRVQNISDGIGVLSTKVFYEYSGNYISVKPEALKFFGENKSFLLKSIILEWAKFLERINIGLPMLISKIEGHRPERRSLEKAKIILGNYFDRCFYCNNPLPSDKQIIHADHFIPWSYIYEDEIWNLVLACRGCNLKKHSSLPPDLFIERLVSRNLKYCNHIEPLKKSLLKLDSEKKYEKAIRKYYQNCMDYGFTIVNF